MDIPPFPVPVGSPPKNEIIENKVRSVKLFYVYQYEILMRYLES